MKIKIGSSKGQMFLIAAVVIVASLVIIKLNVASPAAKKEKEVLEVTFENDIFENIINELNSTIRFSYYEPENITKNVFDFANFTEEKMLGRSMDLTFLYVGSLTNKTTSITNVSLINMLDSTIDANFTFNGQSDARSNIVNYERWDTNFTIAPGTTYDLILRYNNTAGDASTTTTENITVKTKTTKDTYIGFFYVSLESQDATHRGKYQKTINIS
jgi:hypothetical protein